jgi:hypothetical protein
MITKVDVYAEQRKKLAEIDTPFKLDRFITWHGFNVILLSDFLDEFIVQEDSMSDMDRCEMLWGEEVAGIIQEAINTPTTAFPDNSHLADTPKGKKSNYSITHDSKRGISELWEVEGDIYFPLAVRKTDNGGWVIDHLPTGFWVVYADKKGDCVSAIKKLYANWPIAVDLLSDSGLADAPKENSEAWGLLMTLKKMVSKSQ